MAAQTEWPVGILQTDPFHSQREGGLKPAFDGLKESK